jgi:hypothetical protein
MQKTFTAGGHRAARKSILSVAIAAALCSAAIPSYGLGLTTVTGTVAGSLFTPPVNSNNPSSSVASTTVASTYAGAKVCFDLNGNGACDSNEPYTYTASNGSFKLSSLTTANIIAEISTSALNNGSVVTSRNVLRASAAQIAAAKLSPLAPIVAAITPLTTEVVRMTENDGLSFAAAQEALAERIGVTPAEVISDPNTVSGADQTAMLNESVVLTNRFTYAATMVDRGDAGAATIPAAQQSAMALEGIPRYDHIFIIMLENKATLSVDGNSFTPFIDSLLASNNQFTNYFATGNPSEPNYTALGGADDWGITNDDQWNCNATGANAPQDLPLPTNAQAGLASSPFTATCTDTPVVNHNIVGHANLFNAMTTAGMSWRTYSESTNPGQDYRTDSVADPAVIAPDHTYPAGQFTVAGSPSTAYGDATGQIPMPTQLYRTKHHPGMAYQNVRSAPEFVSSNRTLGGGQWTPYLQNSTKYAIPANYNYDQFGSDLSAGNIGQLNFVIPDQCDDMHAITVPGTDSVNKKAITASDCLSVSNGNAPPINVSNDIIMARGDNYVKYLVTEIEASPVWNNPAKRVAIVVMFDEGDATYASSTSQDSGPFNSCCGWNPDNSSVAVPLISNAAGNSTTVDTTIANYFNGNRGHGNSVMAVVTNQPAAPKGIQDSDAYSHFSFVRTLQDMFGLADPDNDGTYMNRSKYTESFISTNILNLPEYTGAADTHFDAVRPMNHSYVIPAGYVEKVSVDQNTAPQVGPDANQINVWTLPASVQ